MKLESLSLSLSSLCSLFIYSIPTEQATTIHVYVLLLLLLLLLATTSTARGATETVNCPIANLLEYKSGNRLLGGSLFGQKLWGPRGPAGCCLL